MQMWGIWFWMIPYNWKIRTQCYTHCTHTYKKRTHSVNGNNYTFPGVGVKGPFGPLNTSSEGGSAGVATCHTSHHHHSGSYSVTHTRRECPKSENGNVRSSFPNVLLTRTSIFKHRAPFLKWSTQLCKEVLMNDSLFVEASTAPVILSLLIQASTPCITDRSHAVTFTVAMNVDDYSQLSTCFIACKWSYIGERGSLGHSLTIHSSIYSFISLSNSLPLCALPHFLCFPVHRLKGPQAVLAN